MLTGSSGLLPADSEVCGKQSVTLLASDRGRFEDRWVYLRINPLSACIFTRGMATAYLRVRHGEGQLVAESPETLKGIRINGLFEMFTSIL